MGQEIGFLPIEALLGALTNAEGGINKLKFVEVATTSDGYFDMPEKVFNKEELLRSLIDIDDDGDYAIRYGTHTATGSTKLSKAELTEDQLIRSVIGAGADGKPYLRMVFQTLA